MKDKLNFQALAHDAGIIYQTGYAPRQLDSMAKAGIANDADLVTAPNAGILAMFTTYVDPRVIEVAVEPMKAAQIFGETKKGSWTDDSLQFPLGESAGEVSSYGDFSENGMASANVNWEARQPYHYQTIVEVGEREVERAGAAKLDWVTRKQISAALVLNKFQNKTYFSGVAGLANYGLLNDPALSASLPGDDWTALTADQVFASIQGALYGRLVGQTKGLIDRSASITLLLSPENEVNLLKTNQYNVNVIDQLAKNFPNMKIETAPEMSTAAGELVYMIVNEFEGVRTVEPTFTEKMRVHPMVLGLSSWKQKRSQGTVGAIIYRPMMVANLLLS